MAIAFLGLGKMGRPMAAHLVSAGHDVRVWNRTPGRAGDLTAMESPTPREAAAGAEVIVSMLFDGDAVQDVLLAGADSAVAGAASGALFIDCSTIGPVAARSVGEQLGQRGMRFVDAPVAGSTPAAVQGTLGVFAGGTDSDFAAARPVLETWGDLARVRHVGPVGSGQALKLVMNLSLGLAMAGLGECLRLAHDLGLDEAVALDTLAAGPFGWTVGQKRDLLQSQDYQPPTFALGAMAKDLGLAVDAAHHDLGLSRAALDAATEAVTAGHGDDDYAALAGYLAFEGHANSQ